MGILGKRIAVSATIIALAPTIAAAQTGGGDGNPGGLQIDIGISTGLTYDSNLSLDPGGDSASIWDTGLTFAFSSVAPNQRFEFVAGGVLRYIDTAGATDFGLEDPRFRLGYTRESLNSRLEFSASYSDVDRDFLDPFLDTTDSSDGGKVATTDAALRYETGLQDPFGFILDLSHNKVEYSGTTDPDLNDNQTDRAGVAARMRVSPVSTVTVSAAQTWYEEQDLLQTDRTTTEYLVRFEHELDQVVAQFDRAHHLVAVVEPDDLPGVLADDLGVHPLDHAVAGAQRQRNKLTAVIRGRHINRSNHPFAADRIGVLRHAQQFLGLHTTRDTERPIRGNLRQFDHMGQHQTTR